MSVPLNEVLRSIQSARKALAAPVLPDFATRKSWVADLLGRLESDFAEPNSSLGQALASEAHGQVELPVAAGCWDGWRDRDQAPQGFAVGVVVGILPSTMSVRTALEWVTAAWLSGCPLVLKFSRRTPVGRDWFASVTSDLKIPSGWVEVLPTGTSVSDSDSDSTFQVLCSHPSVGAILYSGSADRLQDIAQWSFPTRKKISAFVGAKTPALLTKGADLSKVAQVLAADLLRFSGHVPWSVSRVYCLEDQREGLLAELSSCLQKLECRLVPASDSTARASAVSQWQALLKRCESEEGKRILGGPVRESAEGVWAQPGLIRDLPNCSVLHQDPVSQPLVLVSSVKYWHELAKWANTSPWGSLAYVFGSAEAAQQLARKLEYAEVVINGSFSSLSRLPEGAKQSSWGLSSRRPFAPVFFQATEVLGNI